MVFSARSVHRENAVRLPAPQDLVIY